MPNESNYGLCIMDTKKRVAIGGANSTAVVNYLRLFILSKNQI